MFTVEVPKVKNVSILKDLIKEKRPVRFANIDASDLELWKVSFPIDDLASKQPPTLGPSLRPHGLLSDLFTSILDASHIHIVARVPLMGMYVLKWPLRFNSYVPSRFIGSSFLVPTFC